MTGYTDLSIGEIDGLSRCNARQSPATAAETADLAADILARGVLEPLTLRREEGRIRVLDGGRRYLALRHLAEAHPDQAAAIRVPVAFYEGDDAGALERSLVTFIHRADLHPVEEFERFVELRAHGLTAEQIAARTHKTLRYVKERLRLDRLAPEVRAAWRAGDLTGDQARAFSASDNRDAQRALLDTPGVDRYSSRNIEAQLRCGDIPLSDPRVAFVTLDAYLAAGGRLDEQLFETESWLRDAPILDALAREKLEKSAADISFEEGWGWSATQFDGCLAQFLHRAKYDWTDDECDRMAEIEEAIDDGETPEDEARRLAAEAREIEKTALLRAISAGERANMGVFVAIDEHGEAAVTRALLQRPSTPPEAELQETSKRGKAAETAETAERGKNESRPAPAETEDPARSQREIADTAAGAALSAACARAPRLAMIYAVASIGRGLGPSPLAISSAFCIGGARSPLLREIADCPFYEALAIVEARDSDDPSLVVIAFAELVGMALALGPSKNDNFDAARILLAVAGRHCDLRQDMRDAFDYSAWFAAATRESVLDVIRDLDGEAAAAKAKKLKRPALAKAAAILAKDRGWLPPILSTDAPDRMTADAGSKGEGEGEAEDKGAADDRSTAEAMADAIAEDERQKAKPSRRRRARAPRTEQDQ